MLETLLREMDEEGGADDSGETVVHDNDQVWNSIQVQKNKTKSRPKRAHPTAKNIVLCLDRSFLARY